MSERIRPYQYYDFTRSICPHCYERVDAKIVFEQGNVFLDKRCAEHGPMRVLLADDVDYYRRAREVFLKPSEMPQHFQTPVEWGCPYDCGLCNDHEQHSCLTVVELGDHCNLSCPICYAGSGPEAGPYHSLETVRSMLDAVVRGEGQPDVVQLSGGEPTLHPDFFTILDEAKARPIRALMVNTNGIRIARDAAFARRLAEYKPCFEIYLQWDSMREQALRDLRGADLRKIREDALERLNALDLSTTLVVTVKRDVNDDELGEIVDFAAQQPAVRGVTFQPVQTAGRHDGFDPAHHRLTLTEVRRRILEQSSLFAPQDILPVPCHPDCVAMAYALKLEDKVVPLTGLVDPQVLIEGGRNTIVFENDPALHQALFSVLSTGHSPESSSRALGDLLCCLPKISVSGVPQLGYRNVFRVIIMQFLDAWSFDVRSVKKSCVNIAHPDGKRLIPFDTYNLLYRGELERTRLAPLRARVDGTTVNR